MGVALGSSRLGLRPFFVVPAGFGMMSTDRLLRIFVELLFVCLGTLVVWLGFTNHIFFDRRSLGWLVVSIILVLWGARGFYKPAKFLSRGENWNRAISLVLLGLVMLAMSRVRDDLVAPMLAVLGLLLTIRGGIGAFLVVRSKPRML